ncbi:MAG: hypothetical protein HQK54_00010 [Oligoflexales bacterium]|nr:hypothetical protein [Oligoflexales bacterium]
MSKKKGISYQKTITKNPIDVILVEWHKVRIPVKKIGGLLSSLLNEVKHDGGNS